MTSNSLNFIFLAERRGFEPRNPFRGLHAFQACQFSHSCIFPYFGGAKIG